MYNCATSNMRYFISIMCTYNVQPVVTLHVYAAAVSLVLIGHIGPRVDPSHIPPTPLFVSNPCQGQQENWGGKGRSRCRPSPASYAPTASSHGSDPSYMPDAPVISDGPPFYRENAPVGALEPEMTPPLEQRSLEGGGLPRRGVRLGGGGGGLGGKNACFGLKTTTRGKNSTGR